VNSPLPTAAASLSAATPCTITFISRFRFPSLLRSVHCLQHRSNTPCVTSSTRTSPSGDTRGSTAVARLFQNRRPKFSLHMLPKRNDLHTSWLFLCDGRRTTLYRNPAATLQALRIKRAGSNEDKVFSKWTNTGVRHPLKEVHISPVCMLL
jgi:hypothetical protein